MLHTPNYISNMIKSCTGLPLHKYLLHARLENAVKLLEAQNLTVSEIAKMCGFGDLSCFSKYFKKETGISPMQYIAHKP